MDDESYALAPTEQTEIAVVRRDVSLFGRLGRPLVWIRATEEAATERSVPLAWLEFLGSPPWRPLGNVRETFWMSPFWGNHFTYSSRPDSPVLAFTARLGLQPRVGFVTTFDDGFTLVMSNRVFPPNKRESDPSTWVHLVASDDPVESLEYFERAIEFHREQGRQPRTLEGGAELVQLRRDSWICRPHPIDLVKLYGVVGWLAFTVFLTQVATLIFLGFLLLVG